MGLDIVEIFMRAEEVFGIEIPDWKAEQAGTVGNLYRLVCEELRLVPLENPLNGTGRVRGMGKLLNLEVIIWTPEDVWATLVWVVVDQLQVLEDEVLYDTQWGRDLGAD